MQNRNVECSMKENWKKSVLGLNILIENPSEMWCTEKL